MECRGSQCRRGRRRVRKTGVVGDCCYLSFAEAKGRGGVSRRPHGVELGGEDVDYIGGVVIIVREVDVDGKAGVVLGIA